MDKIPYALRNNHSINVELAPNSNIKYYICGQEGTTANSENLKKAYNDSMTGNTSDKGVYFQGDTGVLFGAAWNDFAEFRKGLSIDAGRVVKENGDGTLSITTERLESGCEIISDTYGFAIGKSDEYQLPIAVAGRVLAYPDVDPTLLKIGAPVCSGPNGTVSMMTEEEERKFPSRIIGTISEIPTYDIWHGANDIKVDGRVWIRIR